MSTITVEEIEEYANLILTKNGELDLLEMYRVLHLKTKMSRGLAEAFDRLALHLRPDLTSET